MNFIGKKVGMTRIFDKDGKEIPCTLILIEPNFVVQIKNEKTDGYKALQLAAFEQKKNVKKPKLGAFEKAKINPCRYLKESRVENIEDYKEGQKIEANFPIGSFVDVIGISKGKGYQGPIKLHGFSGGPASHGSKFHRALGSTGGCSFPGRCFPGGKRAGHMGAKRVTLQNLLIVERDKENNLFAVKGAVAGHIGSILYIREAKKKKNKAKG